MVNARFKFRWGFCGVFKGSEEKSITNDQLATRPHKITLSADGSFYLYKIHWKSFGGDEARAVGRAYVRTGCSTCPNRGVERPRVGIRLVHLVDQGNFRVYEHLSYVLQAPIPRGFEHRGAQSMLP